METRSDLNHTAVFYYSCNLVMSVMLVPHDLMYMYMGTLTFCVYSYTYKKILYLHVHVYQLKIVLNCSFLGARQSSGEYIYC